MLNEQQLTDVCNIVNYHAPDEEGVKSISRIRAVTKEFILTILDTCPPSADRSAAIRKAREAMMTANASIVPAGKSI